MLISQADVFTVTDKGSGELKGGATALTKRELAMIVLIDGRRPVSALASLAGIGDPSRIESTLESLLCNGFISTAAAPLDGNLDYFLPATTKRFEPSEQAEASVAREAAAGASALRELGYYVSIARRARSRAKPGPLTVLIIEDEPLVAKYLSALMEMEGFIARVATNREEIIAEVRHSQSPDLVILDVNLPDTSGFEVLYRMKTHPRLVDIPVVMVTTQATRESVMKGLALGADGYITKPFEVDILLRGIKAVLGLLPLAPTTALKSRTASWNDVGSRRAQCH
jgi:two-component system, OmpR family, response regulator